MGLLAAKENDLVVGVDIHIVMVPSPGGPVPTPLPHPYFGKLDTSLSTDVKIENRAAATKGSISTNTPPHIPTPPGVSFQKPPDNKGKIEMGSMTVKINGKDAARITDPVTTCNDVGMKMHSKVVVPFSMVFIGNGGPDPAALSTPWA